MEYPFKESKDYDKIKFKSRNNLILSKQEQYPYSHGG